MSSAAVRERHRRTMQGNPARLRGPRVLGRRWRVIPLAVGVSVVVLVALTGKLFIWPAPGSSPAHADAVLVLPGGRGDRLRRALDLMDRGVAPLLILPGGAEPGWAAAKPLCGRLEPYRVICAGKLIDSVRAQARWAREQHLGLVLVVTSRYNMTRARLDLHRCLGQGFAMSSSSSKDPATTKVRRVADEWISFIQDGLLHRSC